MQATFASTEPMVSWRRILEFLCAGGTIGEFVNPKYKDASKTAFKSSTRLECMMQDYPRALPADARVGFTVINQVGARNVSKG